MTSPWILPFRSIDLQHLPIVGGKNANLGALLGHPSAVGVRVPDGAISADAFRAHLREARIDDAIYAELDALDVRDVAALARVARRVRARIEAAPLPEALARDILVAYAALSAQTGEDATDVAVRSSATAEDSRRRRSRGSRRATSTSVAARPCSPPCGRAWRRCSRTARQERGYAHRAVALSVGVQKMVRSDLACAGVIFTLDTETGFRDVSDHRRVGARQGTGQPDEIIIHKPTLAAGFRPMVQRRIGGKSRKLIYAERGATAEVTVAEADRARLVLSDDESLALARWALASRSTTVVVRWTSSGRRMARPASCSSCRRGRRPCTRAARRRCSSCSVQRRRRRRSSPASASAPRSRAGPRA